MGGAFGCHTAPLLALMARTRTSRHVRFSAALGGEADISRQMRAGAINEYAPAEAKFAQADDSTAHNSSGDLAMPGVPVVIDDESQRRRAKDEAEPRPPTAN